MQLEHDRTRPIGKLMDITADDAGIEATFKIAGTIAGDDSLLEAAEGLRDGFSVGVMVDDWKNKQNSATKKRWPNIQTWNRSVLQTQKHMVPHCPHY